MLIQDHLTRFRVVLSDFTSSQCVPCCLATCGIAVDGNFCYIELGDGKDDSFI